MHHICSKLSNIKDHQDSMNTFKQIDPNFDTYIAYSALNGLKEACSELGYSGNTTN